MRPTHPRRLARAGAVLGMLGSLVVVNPANAGARTLNGFDLADTTIPAREIRTGGPPRDGIPALTRPAVVNAEAGAGFLHPVDLVVGVVIGNTARAYPLKIMTWHENVNDVLGGRAIAVTYCPLCRSALVFDRMIGGKLREFGVSGLLWNSNVLLYDRAPAGRESLWSQIAMRAVSGPAARDGLQLGLLPSVLTTWREWRERHPETSVLSPRTGYRRDYSGEGAYAEYFRTDRLMFPARTQTDRPGRFRRKELLLVARIGERWKAYAVKDIVRAAGRSAYVEDRVGDVDVCLRPAGDGRSTTIELMDNSGTRPPVAYMYWFALSAMQPDIEVYEPR